MLENGTILDIIRLFIGLIILSYASYTDLKTRKASNINWLILGGIGGILLVVQYFTVGFGTQINYLIFIPIMIALVYVLFQLRLIFGGADAKALMAIAVLVPLAPVISELPLGGESLMPASWFIFSNSVLLFLFIPLSLLLFNIARRNIQLPYALLGYKMDIKKAREKFVWPLEKIVDGKRKFAYMPKDFDIEDELDIFEKNDVSKIWVTPKIPFMIPLLAGFICAFVLGDLLYFIMGLFM
jgi:preflagellin peptidase FlaK